MVQYNRKILSLYVKPEKVGLKNVVSRVTWRWAVRDETDYADLYRDTYFDSVDPNNYNDYQSLTDDIVFTWIDAVENIEALQDELDKKLVDSKNPVIIEKKLPWTPQSKYTGEEQYLLVLDDQPNNRLKTLGPMKWNSEVVNTWMRDHNVNDYEFPTDIDLYRAERLPTDDLVTFTDRIKLYRVEYTNNTPIDNTFQYYGDTNWNTSSGKAVGTYSVVNRSVDEVKSILKNQLSDISYQKQFSEISIQIGDDIVALSLKNNTMETKLICHWIAMTDSETIDYKLNETVWMQLNKTQIKQILDNIHSHQSTILNWEKSVFDEIENSDSIDDLKQIKVK